MNQTATDDYDTDVILTCAKCGTQESIPVTFYENDTQNVGWYLQQSNREDVARQAETWLCEDCHRHQQPPSVAGEAQWNVQAIDDDYDGVYDTDGVLIARVAISDADHARLIVTAVNAHRLLVEALEQASELLESLTLGTIPVDERYAETCRVAKQVSAALTTARGK